MTSHQLDAAIIAYSRKYPKALSLRAITRCFTAKQMAQILTEANGRKIHFDVVPGGPTTGYQPTSATYRFIDP